MITPQSHPTFFRTERVGESEYFVPLFSSVGIDEDMEDARREGRRKAYVELHPEELVNGQIDEAKYTGWLPSAANNMRDLVLSLSECVETLDRLSKTNPSPDVNALRASIASAFGCASVLPIVASDESRHVARATLRASARVLFIPKDAMTPPIDADEQWYRLSDAQLGAAISFTTPDSPGNKPSEPPSTVPLASNPASAQTSGQ